MNAITGLEPNLMSGIVTFSDHRLMGDGAWYRGAFSSRWKVVVDDEVGEMLGVPKFHSAERWSLVALDETGAVIGIAPGCDVKSWSYCKSMPLNTRNGPVDVIYDYDAVII